MSAMVTHKPFRAVFCLVAVVLIAAACSGGAEEASREPASAPSNLSLNSSEGAPLADFPAEVVNRWGVTSFKGYLEIDRRQTTDHPYGPLTGGASVIELSLSEVVGSSQAIVVGTVVAISPAYFNSADRGFWREPSSEAGRSILQDVTIDVERVLGDTAGITGEKALIAVTIGGGQIEVSFGASVDPALLPEGLEPGVTYLESMAPNVRVAEGDRVLLSLQRVAAVWFGAPVDPDMPWGKTTVAGCPAVPVGTKNVVAVSDWQLLGADGQQATFVELTVTPAELSSLAPEDQQAAFAERTVTLDELEALARRDLGKSLREPGSPVSPNNWPGRSEPFNDPPQPCNDPGGHPPQSDQPPHTHPEFEE